MKLELVKTDDGSNTFKIPEWEEHYHSKFGAQTEANHIFIENGFNSVKSYDIKIFEVGFGTGLNTILTCQQSDHKGIKAYYEAIEKYPLTWSQVQSLNYNRILSEKLYKEYEKIHSCKWDEVININKNFSFRKIRTDLLDYKPVEYFNAIYFDAFAPDLQPELWTESIFQKMFNCLCKEGILVTYSTKGVVKRNLKAAGFMIEKFPGPAGGKKENLKAIKK